MVSTPTCCCKGETKREKESNTEREREREREPTTPPLKGTLQPHQSTDPENYTKGRICVREKI